MQVLTIASVPGAGALLGHCVALLQKVAIVTIRNRAMAVMDTALSQPEITGFFEVYTIDSCVFWRMIVDDVNRQKKASS